MAKHFCDEIMLVTGEFFLEVVKWGYVVGVGENVGDEFQ